jgi:glycosyltransferase involved in cell wall biosynthesis
LVYFLAIKKIDGVICCSDYVRRVINQRFRLALGKLHLVYNFSSFTEQSLYKAKRWHEESSFRIGFAGRIVKRKGWKDLCKACINLKREYPMLDIELSIAGVGRGEKSLKKTIKKYQSLLSVRYHGFVKEMHEFYADIDILCVPSHWEPLGMVHIEAMSFGVPIVASDVSGMNEILTNNKNALLYKAKDINKLEKLIYQLISDKSLYEKLSKQGIETAKAFSYAIFEQRIQDVYTVLKL